MVKFYARATCKSLDVGSTLAARMLNFVHDPSKLQIVTHTVGTYSPGKVLLTCAIIIHVFPTVPSPTATHLTCLRLVDISSVLFFSFEISAVTKLNGLYQYMGSHLAIVYACSINMYSF